MSRGKATPKAVQTPATHSARGGMNRVKYYWAYGSNLNVEQMMFRCPNAQKVGPLYLPNGKLVFRYHADVIGRADSWIAGGLWKVTPHCIEALDRYEGVNSKYYKKLYLTLDVKGKVEDCLFYQMNKPKNEDGPGFSPPGDEYLETIVQGFEDFGLDRELLDTALQHAWDNKNKTPDVKRRWVRAGKPKLARTIVAPFREEMVEGA